MQQYGIVDGIIGAMPALYFFSLSTLDQFEQYLLKLRGQLLWHWGTLAESEKEKKMCFSLQICFQVVKTLCFINN